MMTKLKTILGATVAALSIGALAAPANSATVILPVAGGPFSGLNSYGGFPVIRLLKANTYDFTFDLVAPVVGDTDTQLEAQAHNAKQLIQYDLYSGTPTGANTNLTTSPLSDSSELVEALAPGDYFVQVKPGYIAVSGEVSSGSLITASVPEPASWALMILGVTAIGGALRGRKRLAAA